MSAVGSKLRRLAHTIVAFRRIRFLNDCTHELAGQTVDLPDAPGN